jgi:hypothetical protein
MVRNSGGNEPSLETNWTADTSAAIHPERAQERVATILRIRPTERGGRVTKALAAKLSWMDRLAAPAI